MCANARQQGLFPEPGSRPVNLLPFDGEALYFGPILQPASAADFLAAFRDSIPWRHDEVVIFGRRMRTARQVAWYGDAPFTYSYSGTARTALPWTEELLRLRRIVEERSNATFNSCLLNLYEHGGQGIAWHSDDEPALGPNPVIASVSLGADRRFCFRHKQTRQDISIVLENGSLLLMAGLTQACWVHSLPKATRVVTPRINLTFRTIHPDLAAPSRRSARARGEPSDTH